MSSRAPEETEYNNWPVLKVYTGKQYKGDDEYIMLGVRKAAAICDQIDHIRIFVEKHGG
jgi:hypothetical protein